MEIYIVRHGETIWNRAGRLQGDTDIELNENGRKEARRVGEQLKHIEFDKIYTSPLVRAYETACLICGNREIPIIEDERLKEVCFGEDEGRTKAQMDQDPACGFRYFFAQPEKYFPAKGGETLEQACIRAAMFLQEVVESKAQEYKRIMIVGHGAINKALMCHIFNHGIRDYWSGGLQKNCGITVVQFNKGDYHLLPDESEK